MKHLYVILSQTGTVLNRVITAVTKERLGHASLSFQDDLHIMYSFGRRRPNNPFLGGFVKMLPEAWGNVVNYAGFVLVCWLFLYFLYKQKIFLKV